VTALTADLGSLLLVKYGNIQAFIPGTDVTIYDGALCVLRLTDGKLYPAEADNDDSLKQLVIGFAREGKIPTDSKTEVRVRLDGKLRVNFTGGTPVCGRLGIILDDNTLQPFNDAGEKKNIVAGRIREIIDAQTVYLNLEDRPVRIATSVYD